MSRVITLHLKYPVLYGNFIQREPAGNAGLPWHDSEGACLQDGNIQAFHRKLPECPMQHASRRLCLQDCGRPAYDGRGLGEWKWPACIGSIPHHKVPGFFSWIWKAPCGRPKCPSTPSAFPAEIALRLIVYNCVNTQKSDSIRRDVYLKKRALEPACLKPLIYFTL